MSLVRLTDFAAIVCAPDTTVRRAMERMTETGNLFQVVADRTGRVLGTVTDGDVRRAILSGVAVEESIVRIMQREPVIGRIDRLDANRDLLEWLRRASPHAAFLPVVDESGTLREILAFADVESEPPAALIMAGGLGRRLGERTRDLPKPLLPVGGKPIVERLIARLEETQVRRVYIAVHYLADKIAEFAAGRPGIAELSILREDEPLGTAGAIGRIDDLPAGGLLVLNGDVLTDVDYGALVSFHRRNRHDGTVAVAQYQVDVPYGVVRHNDDGLFLGIQEKPCMHYFVAAGIYLLSPEFCALVRPDQRLDMPDLMELGRGAGLRVGLFPIHEYWKDLGRPQDLETAERDLDRVANRERE
ncbi:MAG TPA: sugar phosphate nucleotidyltransferase [Alphaproteobacteria bacterium]